MVRFQLHVDVTDYNKSRMNHIPEGHFINDMTICKILQFSLIKQNNHKVLWPLRPHLPFMLFHVCEYVSAPFRTLSGSIRFLLNKLTSSDAYLHCAVKASWPFTQHITDRRSGAVMRSFSAWLTACRPPFTVYRIRELLEERFYRVSCRS